MKTVLVKTVSLVIMICISFISVQTLNAQPPKNGERPAMNGGHPPKFDEQHIQKMVEEMKKELALSSEQESKIKELITAHFKEMDATMREQREKEHEEMDKNRTAFESQIKKLLSETQKTSFEKMIAEHEKHKPKARDEKEPVK